MSVPKLVYTKIMILFLEDDETRVTEFRCAVSMLGRDISIQFWRDAPTMIAECEPLLSECSLISLDHDLNPAEGVTADPGTGMDVARFLATRKPNCPIIIHTSNHEARWSMFNELRFGGWQPEIVGPIGEGWITRLWLPRVKSLLRNCDPRNRD